MTLLNALFRSGRTTPAPTPTSGLEAPVTPPNKSTSARPVPPSAYKTTQAPSALLTTSTPRTYPSPAPIKVRDFAIPPSHDRSRRLPDLPSPPTPDTGSRKSHQRSVSNASSLSSVRVMSTFEIPRSPTSQKGTKTPPKSSHPPTAFTPPRQHQRAQSGPSPMRATKPGIRARSATIQPLGATSLARAAQVEDDKPLAHNVPSHTAPGALSGRPAETKRRPVALNLRLTDLTPPHSSSHLKHLPPVFSDPTRGGYLIPPAETPMPEAPGKPTPPPKQSLQGLSVAAALDTAERKITQSYESRPKQRDGTPLGVNPAAPRSQYPPPTTANTVTPFSINPTPPHMFPHVPLPWSSSSASQLSQEHGPRFDSLIEDTLNHLSPSSPRVLRPSILKTSAAEEARLRSELVKLQDKYAALVGQRDGLLASLGTPGTNNDGCGVFRTTVERLQKATNRCDRLARQILICNDQIRQIEVQGQGHVVGALRVALERAEGTLSCSSDTPSIVTKERVDAVVQPVTFDPIIRSGRLQRDADDYDRTSTATVISLNQLGFPLPPIRDTPSPSGSTLVLPRLAEASQPFGQFTPETTLSASTSRLLVAVDPSDKIVIYPPGHRRSFSAPLLGLPELDLPHTPWRGQADSTALTGTRPLRLRPGGRRTGGKAKSMAHKGRSSDTLRRVRRGRESQLEAVSV